MKGWVAIDVIADWAVIEGQDGIAEEALKFVVRIGNSYRRDEDYSDSREEISALDAKKVDATNILHRDDPRCLLGRRCCSLSISLTDRDVHLLAREYARASGHCNRVRSSI